MSHPTFSNQLRTRHVASNLWDRVSWGARARDEPPLNKRGRSLPFSSCFITDSLVLRVIGIKGRHNRDLFVIKSLIFISNLVFKLRFIVIHTATELYTVAVCMTMASILLNQTSIRIYSQDTQIKFSNVKQTIIVEAVKIKPIL